MTKEERLQRDISRLAEMKAHEDELRQQGYETAVCWSAEEAMDTIAGYLGVMEQTGRKVEL